MRSGNLYRGVPRHLTDELVTPLAGAGSVRVKRIVSRGHSSPPGFWYDQDETEYVVVLVGGAKLELEGGEARTLEPGDWIEIPPHVRHRVASTRPDQDTVWLAVFYPPGDAS